MLDYWVRLHRQYRCDVDQVVIFLQQTNSEDVFKYQFTAANTRHRYRVIRLWEQDPEPLLASSALLPLLTRKFGAIAPEIQNQIQQLSIPQLEELGEALLDFSSMTDLTNWLSAQTSN
jgi:Domain of unknown function (DUF4351)